MGGGYAGLQILTNNWEEEVLLVPSTNTGRRSAFADDLKIIQNSLKNSQHFAVQHCIFRMALSGLRRRGVLDSVTT